MVFQESGFSFEFPSSWVVVKFDDHRFYKYLSGDGFKGVDFLCLDSNCQLYFLEIKNYLNLFPLNGIHPTDEFIAAPTKYTETYWNKYLDSVHLIELIHKYYRRRWWFRLLLKFNRPSIFRLARNRDWGFWTLAYFNLQDSKSEKQFHLWLELDFEKDKEVKESLSQVRKNLENYAQEKNLSISLLHSKKPGLLKAR